jgi:hypothetical protein
MSVKPATKKAPRQRGAFFNEGRLCFRPFSSFFGIECNPFRVSVGIVADGFLRAFGDADAAINAGIRIYNQLAVAFTESGNRADFNAGFAFDAGIVNYRNH